MPWFKGNLHCHTTLSDGRSDPAAVAAYYRDSGHDFLGISDHHQLTSPEWAQAAGLTGIPCCEYTGPEYCHVVGVGVAAPVAAAPEAEAIMARLAEAGQAATRVAILQDGVDKILAVGGIPVLCHPFWHWAYGWEMAAAVCGWRHVEICNAAPDCNPQPLPGGDHQGEFWSGLLGAGHRAFGLATDDAHFHAGPYDPHQGLGGRGWITVKARSAAAPDLLAAIRDGHFYASTGVQLAEYAVDATSMRLALQSPFVGCVAAFEFLGGHDGAILHRVIGEGAEYRFRGDEGHVRGQVVTTAGSRAWTQPVWLDDLAAAAWTRAP